MTEHEANENLVQCYKDYAEQMEAMTRKILAAYKSLWNSVYGGLK
jgi:hypothetical protein